MKKNVYLSLIFLASFTGCEEIIDALIPDCSITECYWKNNIDNDKDGYVRTKELIVEYNYPSEDLQSGMITVYCKGRTSPVAQKQLISNLIDGTESIPISGLAHNQYNFDVHLDISQTGSSSNATKDYSEDQDLKEQNFETDAEDR